MNRANTVEVVTSVSELKKAMGNRIDLIHLDKKLIGVLQLVGKVNRPAFIKLLVKKLAIDERYYQVVPFEKRDGLSWCLANEQNNDEPISRII